MQPKTLLALSLLVAGLGAFIFLYEKDLPSTDERLERAKRVLQLEADEIDSLEIAWDGQTVRLERQKADGDEGTEASEDGDDTTNASTADAGWRITAPLDARADATAVDGLVRSLVELEHSRVLESVDREGVGLDTPRARVAIAAADEQKVLEIGAEVPASSDMIVGVAGNSDAYQVGTTIFGDLTQEPGDWRDKQLFTASRGEIDRVTLLPGSLLPGGDEKVLLARRGDDFWIESPLTDRADDDAVNSLLTEITGLRIETFLDEPLLDTASLGLEPASGVIEVQLAGREAPFRFELGQAKEGSDGTFYGRESGQLFELATQLGDSLATPASAWRSKAWTSTQVFKIESARLEDAEGVLEVSREDADWKRGEERIAYSAVSDFLYPLTEVKGEEIIDRQAAIDRGYDLENPELTVALVTEDTSEELTLFAAQGDLAAATTEGRDAVLLLPQEKVSEIREKLGALRAAEPLPEENAEAVDDTSDESTEP